jgi:hypothetical protein
MRFKIAAKSNFKMVVQPIDTRYVKKQILGEMLMRLFGDDYTVEVSLHCTVECLSLYPTVLIEDVGSGLSLFNYCASRTDECIHWYLVESCMSELTVLGRDYGVTNEFGSIARIVEVEILMLGLK